MSLPSSFPSVPAKKYPRRLARQFYHYWLKAIIDPEKTAAFFRHLIPYWLEWRRYAEMPNAEPLSWVNSYPCLEDRTSTTGFDTHYFYQAIWAMERIANAKKNWHLDLGSDVRFVAMLTTHLPVVFGDIRPLSATVNRLSNVTANLTTLPFANRSVQSLSCLHVAEHVGLGRYGDALNPEGTRLACAELTRVLAGGGNLFFSVPVGKPRVCFNAHRIHHPKQILDYFAELKLSEFSFVSDQGQFLVNVAPDQAENADYACGLYWFCRDE